MKTNRIVLTLFMGLMLMATNSGAATRDTHQTHAPPKPSQDAWAITAMTDVNVVTPSNELLYVNRYECMDVVSGITLKVNNDYIVPVRPVMEQQTYAYKPYKVIDWPDSKRYSRWLLRAQCTAIH